MTGQLKLIKMCFYESSKLLYEFYAFKVQRFEISHQNFRNQCLSLMHDSFSGNAKNYLIEKYPIFVASVSFLTPILIFIIMCTI